MPHAMGPPPPDDDAAIRKRIRDARAAQEKAQRDRIAELAQPDAGLRHHADLGPARLLKSGVTDFDKAAHIPTDPDQPDTRHVRGARAQRVWAPERMAKRDESISSEALDAARRFYDEWLVSEYGARAGQDMSGIRQDPWSRLPYSQRRAMCRQSVAMVVTKIGPRAWSVVRWCVCQETPGPASAPTLQAWAKTTGFDQKTGKGMLVVALDVMAVHYGYSKPSPGTIVQARGGV